MRTAEPIRLLWFTLVAAVAVAQQKESAPLPTTPEDLANGGHLYREHCAPCHGQTGRGNVRFPSLDHPKLSSAADDDALVSVIQNGIDGSGMLPVSQLSGLEARQVAAFVRSLGRTTVSSLAGDQARGRQLYDTKGCRACHIVKEVGIGLGPELTEIGSQRNPAYLREAVLNPAATLPEGFLMVRVVSRDGREVHGIRLNEDAFTIQMKDAGNRFYSFRKSELKQLEKQFGATPMSSYAGKLSNSEIDDLVAYLASLRGEQ